MKGDLNKKGQNSNRKVNRMSRAVCKEIISWMDKKKE